MTTLLAIPPTFPVGAPWNTLGPGYRDAMAPEPGPDAASPDVAIEHLWAVGEDSALRQAWERFGTLVFTYCSRALRDRDLAGDCTQETFVSAWRSRARFDRSKGSLASWLLGIARYRVLDAYRAAPRLPIPTDPHDLTAPPHAAEIETVADQLLVADALEQLPERARRVIELAFYSELTQQEIADRLALPLGTVKSDMRRGLLRLRHQLEGGEHDVRRPW